MKKFMDEDFLLLSETGKKLYHDYAKDMPIYDYHCHLNAKEIAEDTKYKNITEAWLGSDHYKWRAMRSNGVKEKYITGDADDKKKFMKWAETIEYCIGNPLYHWTHLELNRFFGIDTILSSKTAEEIWTKCNALLKKDSYSARNLIKNSNVKVIGTTDDPTDSLEHHIALKNDTEFEVKVVPAFRPDKSYNIEKEDFVIWIEKLGDVTGKEISSFSDLKEALKSRIEFFHEVGCRISDHGLEPIYYKECTSVEADIIFKKGLNKQPISQEEIEKYKTKVMVFLGKQYTKFGWVMQLHLGAIRNNSKRMFKLIGADTGFDAMTDYPLAEPLVNFLNELDKTNELSKTILYCLNPSANEVLGSVMGCFQGGGISGKMQFGSGWWFNDQKNGMEQQMTTLANLGLFRRFVGMITDSRSFLSYTRHEYFRRILCNILGNWVETGEVPNDVELIGNIVKDICFNNAEEYFGI